MLNHYSCRWDCSCIKQKINGFQLKSRFQAKENSRHWKRIQRYFTSLHRCEYTRQCLKQFQGWTTFNKPSYPEWDNMNDERRNLFESFTFQESNCVGSKEMSSQFMKRLKRRRRSLSKGKNIKEFNKRLGAKGTSASIKIPNLLNCDL